VTTTAEKIAVMQAFEDGEAIERLDCGKWSPFNYEPSWNWYKYSYRIKPQPKIIYVNEYSGILNAFLSYSSAVSCSDSCTDSVGHRYIELTPELEKLAKERGLL
jgi:hypothetical protein